MTIKVIHLHTFKCAGTTFALDLAKNFGPKFKCVDPINRSLRFRLEDVEHHSLFEGIEITSSHTIIPPTPSKDGPMIIGFVREPSSRLLSAWHFYRYQEKLPEFPFSAYLKRQSKIKNYQSRVFSHQIFSENDPHKGWELRTDQTMFGRNFFVGVVERYAESMVVIEFLLSKKGFDFRGDVNARENSMPIAKVAPDVEIPNDYINIDAILYQRCSSLLDAYTQIIPNFPERLLEIQNRIPNQSGNEHRHLLDKENHLVVDQLLINSK
jgi:hypothetical protein